MGSTISNSAPIAPIVSGVEPAQQSDAERTSDLQRAYHEQCRAALGKRDDGRDCDDTEAQRAHARKKTKRNGEPPGAAGGMPAPHAARDRAFALRFGGARLGEARSGANARDARVGAGAEADIEAGIEAGVGWAPTRMRRAARARAAKSRRAAARRCAATRRPPARFARLANAHPPLRRPTRTRRKRRPRARRRPCRCRRRTRRRARRAAARAISRPPPRGFARRRRTRRRASSRRARRRCPPRAGRPRRRPPHRPCRPCRRHDARRPPLRRALRANASTATIRTVRATRRSPACRAAFNRRRRCAPPSPRRAHDPSRAARQRAQAGAAQADARDVRETQGTQVRYSFNSWDGRPAVELRFDAGGAPRVVNAQPSHDRVQRAMEHGADRLSPGWTVEFDRSRADDDSGGRSPWRRARQEPEADER